MCRANSGLTLSSKPEHENRAHLALRASPILPTSYKAEEASNLHQMCSFFISMISVQCAISTLAAGFYFSRKTCILIQEVYTLCLRKKDVP